MKKQEEKLFTTIISNSPLELSEQFKIEVCEDVYRTSKALLQLEEFQTKEARQSLAVTCSFTSFDLKLNFYDSETGLVTPPLSTEAAFPAKTKKSKLNFSTKRHTDKLLKLLRHRATSSVKANSFANLKVTHIPAGATLDDYKEQIANDPAGIIVVCAPTGFGKTSLLDSLCRDTVNAGGRYAHYSPLRNISSCTFKKHESWGLPVCYYEKMTKEHILRHQDFSVVSTMHSLHKDKVSYLTKNVDLEVIDEAFSGMRHIATFKDMTERLSAVEGIFEKLNSANRIILADADLNDGDVKMLSRLKNPKGISVYYRERNYSNINVSVTHDHYSAVVKNFAENVCQPGNPGVFLSDSKSVCDSMNVLLTQQFGLKGLLITSETADSDEVQRFEMNPDGELLEQGYDYLIYSPRYFRYGSVESDYFKHGSAIFCGVVPPADCIQGLRRARQLDSWFIGFKKCSSRGFWVKHWNTMDADSYIKSHCAEARLLTEEIEVTLPAAIERLGFNLREGSAELSLSRGEKDLYTGLFNGAKEALVQHRLQMIKESSEISIEEALSRHESKSELCATEKNEMNLALCKACTGKTTDQALKWFLNRDGFNNLKLLDTVFAKDFECAELDQIEIDRRTASSDRFYYRAKNREFAGFVSALISEDGYNSETLAGSFGVMRDSETWEHYGLTKFPFNPTPRNLMVFTSKLAVDMGFNPDRTDSGRSYRLTNLDKVLEYYAHFRNSPASPFYKLRNQGAQKAA